MNYRTRTYIAGDWTGDKNLIDALYKWDESTRYAFSFVDAHEFTQSKDTSAPCSIKKSLGKRLDISKVFVLIVGEHTNKLTKGSCSNCGLYIKDYGCFNGNPISKKSFIEYECDKAVRDGLRIVVLYNSILMDRNKCPESVRYTGYHLPARVFKLDHVDWDYPSIRKAIMG